MEERQAKSGWATRERGVCAEVQLPLLLKVMLDSLAGSKGFTDPHKLIKGHVLSLIVVKMKDFSRILKQTAHVSLQGLEFHSHLQHLI